MTTLLAYGHVALFALVQIGLLLLAYLGRAKAWFCVQILFSLGLFSLGAVQNSGRGSWVLMMLALVTLPATSMISGFLAWLGFKVRSRAARNHGHLPDDPRSSLMEPTS